MAYYGGDRPMGADPETLPDNPCKSCWQNGAMAGTDLCDECDEMLTAVFGDDADTDPYAKY